MSAFAETSNFYSKFLEHTMVSSKSSSEAPASSSSLSDNEEESFLHPEEKRLSHTSNRSNLISILPWISSSILALLLTISVFQGWKLGGSNGSYETGFATELRKNSSFGDS
jgi:hypothetical protein